MTSSLSLSPANWVVVLHAPWAAANVPVLPHRSSMSSGLSLGSAKGVQFICMGATMLFALVVAPGAAADGATA